MAARSRRAWAAPPPARTLTVLQVTLAARCSLRSSPSARPSAVWPPCRSAGPAAPVGASGSPCKLRFTVASAPGGRSRPPTARRCLHQRPREAGGGSVAQTHPPAAGPPGHWQQPGSWPPCLAKSAQLTQRSPPPAPAAVQTRRSAVVAQATRPLWQPGVEAPKHLDGTMPGDFGFGERGTHADAAR